MMAMSALHTLVNGIPTLLTEGKDNPAADFSDTPLWISLIKALIIFVYLLLSTLLVIWFERRVIGRMQQRPGPNRNGPFGLLQTLADALKALRAFGTRLKTFTFRGIPAQDWGEQTTYFAALLEGVKEGHFSVEQADAYGDIQVQSHLRDD